MNACPSPHWNYDNAKPAEHASTIAVVAIGAMAAMFLVNTALLSWSLLDTPSLVTTLKALLFP